MSKRNAERLGPVLAEWERGNFAAWLDVFSSDVLLTSLVPSGKVVKRGPKIRGYLGEFLEQWRHYRIKVERVLEVNESTVVMEGRQLGVGKSSGLEIDESLTVIFRFDQGQVVEMHWHPQREGALEAAGLSE